MQALTLWSLEIQRKDKEIQSLGDRLRKGQLSRKNTSEYAKMISDVQALKRQACRPKGAKPDSTLLADRTFPDFWLTKIWKALEIEALIQSSAFRRIRPQGNT